MLAATEHVIRGHVAFPIPPPHFWLEYNVESPGAQTPCSVVMSQGQCRICPPATPLDFRCPPLTSQTLGSLQVCRADRAVISVMTLPHHCLLFSACRQPTWCLTNREHPHQWFLPCAPTGPFVHCSPQVMPPICLNLLTVSIYDINRLLITHQCKISYLNIINLKPLSQRHKDVLQQLTISIILVLLLCELHRLPEEREKKVRAKEKPRSPS